MLYEQIVKEAYLWSRKNRMEDRGRKAQNLSLSHSVSLKYLLHSRAENLSISEEKKKSKPEYKLTATSGFRKLLWYFYMPVEIGHCPSNIEVYIMAITFFHHWYQKKQRNLLSGFRLDQRKRFCRFMSFELSKVVLVISYFKLCSLEQIRTFHDYN